MLQSKNLFTKKALVATLFTVCSLFFVNTLSAQSTVYFFIASMSNIQTCDFKLNGEKIFDTKESPIVKTIKADGLNKFIQDFVVYSACYKKCTFNKEGKNIFSADIEGLNISTGETSKYAAEIQLNLTEGSTHYILLKNKGLFDCQLKEITQKEADKLLKGKKRYKTYIALPEYVEDIQTSK